VLLRLVSPVKRPGSKNGQFQKRVPTEIRDRMIGRTLVIPLGDGTVSATVDKFGFVRFSLRTSDPSEIKARQADALAYLERLFDAERHNRPIELSRRLAVALAGTLYRAWIDGAEREQTIALQHGPDGWERVHGGDADGSEEAAGFRAVAERMVALGDGADVVALERALGPVVDVVGARPDVMLPRLTPGSREMILVEFARAVRDMAERRARQAEGDYSHDPNSGRFPAWERPVDASGGGAGPSPSPAEVTLTGLVEEWWRENKKLGKARSTYVNYKGVFGKLVAFLALGAARRSTADDAHRLTAEDVVSYKDHRLNVDEVAPRTVNDNDLAALRSVLGWAVDNRKLPANVALGIRLKGVEKETGRAFTEEEAKAVLRAASAVRWSGKGLEGTALARRWLPWLQAYSGARVGEVGQLRKEDVTLVREGDTEYWAYAIRQEAGTVKGKKDRQVPVHPHLVELGFIDMVKAAPGGYLFLTPNPTEEDPQGVLGPLQGVKNRVAEAAREVVPDKTVAPNHGWRHRFTLLSYEHDVSEDLARVIVGHSGKDVHAKVYGLKGKGAGLYREMCKLPKINLD
jgi:integrase